MEKKEKNLLKKGRAYLMEDLKIDSNNVIDTEEYQDLMADFEEQQNEIIEKLNTIEAGTKEYVETANEYVKLQDDYTNKVAEIIDTIESRNFEQLGNKAENIIADAKKRAENMIQALYRAQNELDYCKSQEELEKEEEYFLDGLNTFVPQKVSIEMALACIHADLIRHYEALEDDKASTKEINDFITDLVANSSLIDHKQKSLDNLRSLDLQLFNNSDSEVSSIASANLKNIKSNVMLTDQIITGFFKKPIYPRLDGTGGTWRTDNRNEIEIKNNEEEITSFFTLSWPNDTKFSKKLNGTDKGLFEGIITGMLPEDYKKVMKNPDAVTLVLTDRQVEQICNGRIGQDIRLTDKQMKKNDKSLHKLLHTEIEIDCTQEIEKHGIDLGGNIVKRKAPMIYFEEIEVTAKNGKKQHAYLFKGLPLLARYCIAKDRVLRIDPKLLDVSSEVSSNKENSFEFTQYIAKRIGQIYKGYLSKTKILYETIYKETGVLEPNERINQEDYKTLKAYNQAIKDAKAKDRNTIDAILEAEKKNGFIKSYKRTKKGYEYDGVKIYFTEDQLREIAVNKVKRHQGEIETIAELKSTEKPTTKH